MAAHDAHTCHTIHSRVRIHLLCSCRCSRHVGSGGGAQRPKRLTVSGERRWQRSTAAGKDATRFTRSVSVLLHPCAKHAPVASDPARAVGRSEEGGGTAHHAEITRQRLLVAVVLARHDEQASDREAARQAWQQQDASWQRPPATAPVPAQGFDSQACERESGMESWPGRCMGATATLGATLDCCENQQARQRSMGNASSSRRGGARIAGGVCEGGRWEVGVRWC